MPTQERDAMLCSDCPPAGYPTDETRCAICPRRSPQPGRSYFDRSQGANTFNPEAQFDADRAKEGL